MSKASFSCFTCGDVGHIAAECPRAGDAGTRNPPWCGICDERTRHVSLGESLVGRCTVCHPLRAKQLKQHRKCPSCHMTVYEHDNAPCGQHSGPTATDKRLDREHIEHIVSGAA